MECTAFQFCHIQGVSSTYYNFFHDFLSAIIKYLVDIQVWKSGFGFGAKTEHKSSKGQIRNLK